MHLFKKTHKKNNPYSRNADEEDKSSDEGDQQYNRDSKNFNINLNNQLSQIKLPNIENITLEQINLPNIEKIILEQNLNCKANMELTLTLNPLKYIEKLNTFDGRREDLYTFITNVDGITPTLNKYDNQSQTMCINILKSKLIGKAKRCIEIHAHLSTWKEIKELLVENFGGFKSSFQLYDDLRQTPYKGNVVSFYNEIQKKIFAN